MSEPPSVLMNAEQISRAIESLAQEIAERRAEQLPLALVGIRTRGVPLAKRFARRLGELCKQSPLVGAIDITLYRDDLSRTLRSPVLRGTDVPFSVDGKELVLVDDVLYTGRTVRAAMDAVCDLGRPAQVRLAVLVDRGRRELPIQPDYCALRIPTQPHERIDVRLTETDGEDKVLKESTL